MLLKNSPQKLWAGQQQTQKDYIFCLMERVQMMDYFIDDQ